MPSNSSINNYKQTVMTVTGDLGTLRDICREMGLSAGADAVEGALERLASDTFNVAIVGEFKRGKSTLINALLEKRILPADVLPCSATLNRVTYGIEPRVEIEYRDGSREEVPVDELENYVTKLTPESEAKAAEVKSATVFYPISFCKNGVTIIDTPGLNDDAAMTEVTLSVLPEADAAIMVMMCGSPFSESERQFLEQKIMAADMGRVIFVVTGIDRYEEDEVEKLLGLFRRRITESVLVKAATVYGEDSDEYRVYQQKLGSVRIFPVSSRDALRAKARGDERLLAESRFPAFEDGLMDFLARDRGALQLSAPVSRARKTAAEVLKTVEMRVGALGMDTEQFEERYKEALARIEELRRERAAELEKVTVSAEATYQELVPQVEELWSECERAALEAVDAYPIANVKELKNQSTADGMASAVANAMQNQMQVFAERVQHTLEKAIAVEEGRLSDFGDSFTQGTFDIQSAFMDQAASDPGNQSMEGVKTGAINAAAFYGGLLLGNSGGGLLGTAIASGIDGYKRGGVGGAVLGGGVATVGAFGATAGLAGLASVAGIAMTAPVAIPIVLAAGALGGTLGRVAVGAAFKGKQIDDFREQFRALCRERLSELKAENDLTRDLRDQVTQTFDALKQQVVSETECVLEDMSAQLNDLRVEMASAENARGIERDRLSDLSRRAASVLERSFGIEQELSRVLIQAG